MRLDAAHGSRRHALRLTERSADGEDLLPVRDGRLRRLRASQRHGPHRRRATFGSIQRTATSRTAIRHEDARRHLDRRRELHLHRRRGADDPLVRRDESRSRRPRIPTRGWSASRGRRRCPAIACRRDEGSASNGAADGRRGRRGLDLRVVGGQFEDGVAAGGDVHHLRPLIGLALERDRPVRLHGVVPGAQPHVGGAIQRRDDPPGRRAWRVVADEQRMARHRRRLPLGVDQRRP